MSTHLFGEPDSCNILLVYQQNDVISLISHIKCMDQVVVVIPNNISPFLVLSLASCRLIILPLAASTVSNTGFMIPILPIDMLSEI